MHSIAAPLINLCAALRSFVDAEKVLTDVCRTVQLSLLSLLTTTLQLITIPNKPSAWDQEQAVNRVILLKQFTITVPPVYDALAGAQSDLLIRIREFCAPTVIAPIRDMIDAVVNDDITFAKAPLELRYQRNYAIKVRYACMYGSSAYFGSPGRTE